CEELRLSSFGWRSAHRLCHCRAKLFLHETVEGLAGLPHVVDIKTLLSLARAVQDQAFRGLVGAHRRVPVHPFRDVVVHLPRELRGCRQDSDCHFASLAIGQPRFYESFSANASSSFLSGVIPEHWHRRPNGRRLPLALVGSERL